MSLCTDEQFKLRTARLDEMLTQKEQQNKKESKRYQLFDICLAVGFALVLHVIFLVSWVYSEPKVNMQASSFKQKPIRVRLVYAPKKLRPEVIPEKQLVATIKPVTIDRPENADYISEYDQKVKEQTKSSSVSSHLTEHETKSSQDIKKIGPQVLLPEQRAGARKKVNLNRGKNGVLKKLTIASDTSTGGHDLLNLMPSVQDLERYHGSAFNDHLEDIEEDTSTRLNTFQWKHATYFNRIKESVSQVWSPDRQIKKYDPQGTLFGQRDRYTIVDVTLDREGVVTEVNIKTKSGVDYLDEEAVRTFKKAGPFPHPPLAVFGDRHTFHFAFGFHVSYERGFFSDYGW